MCLSAVYIDSGTGREEVMRDVAEMEAERKGFSLVNLIGEKTFVKGRIRSIDFVDEHMVVMERDR